MKYPTLLALLLASCQYPGGGHTLSGTFINSIIPITTIAGPSTLTPTTTVTLPVGGAGGLGALGGLAPLSTADTAGATVPPYTVCGSCSISDAGAPSLSPPGTQTPAI